MKERGSSYCESVENSVKEAGGGGVWRGGGVLEIMGPPACRTFRGNRDQGRLRRWLIPQTIRRKPDQNSETPSLIYFLRSARPHL